ncbi:hypothetical protein NE237_019105 [Protea cynaroides]|uniref:MTTase N-terminal domain-containing protein n=1 Tax=Protea cynaroides TaxID=273540 RepID=A0A9Q0KB59_9MAGN|nr:hypothetical protein NE237_019105 [Protea cynaroides]
MEDPSKVGGNFNLPRNSFKLPPRCYSSLKWPKPSVFSLTWRMEDLSKVGGNFNLPRNSFKLPPSPRESPQVQDRLPTPSPKIPGIQSDSEYMAGQLSAFGYTLSDSPEEADLWLINTCTVKSPSPSAMETLISKCRSAKNHWWWLDVCLKGVEI